MSLLFQPTPLQKRASAFDDANWIFELKYDGFRALVVIEHSRAQLISRNGHPFASFADLARDIAVAIPNARLTVLDGEIVCADKKGRPQFRDLLFRRGRSVFLRIRPSILRGQGLAQGGAHGSQARAAAIAVQRTC